MDHGHHFVDIVDKTGRVIAQKLRRDIDKTTDVYHSVFTLLITPWGELVFAKIPMRTDFPNLYANQLGTTVATIRRSNETPNQAALRSLSRELFIDGAELYHLGDKFTECADGHQTFLSAYYLIASPPQTYSKTDSNGFVTQSTTQFRKELLENPAGFSPTLRALWAEYQDQLPL